MEELWEFIPKYPNYQVSNSGKIYSLNKDKLLTPSIVWSGYKMVRLYNKGYSKDYSVHRLVAQSWCNNPDNKKVVNHKDGDKLNNYFLNLEWVTDSENQIHAYKTGLKKVMCGNNHPMSKLNENNIIEIRKLYETGLTNVIIADIFKVDQATIARITSNKTWSHIK